MKVNNCYICHNNKHKALYIKNKFTIVQCDNCEFVYVLEKLNKNVLKEYYNNFDYKYIINVEKRIRDDARRSCLVLKKFIRKQNNLFDVGCGRGFFLDEARRMGWTVAGIDSSTSMVSYAREKLHLNVDQGDILNHKKHNKYDVITLHQVIEHFDDPIRLLRTCYGLLNTKGYVYIATPNINSLSSRVQKERFDHLIPPEHLSYFSQKILKAVLEAIGFQFIYSGYWSYPADLGGIIKSLIKRPRTSQQGLLSDTLLNNDEPRDIVKKIKSFLFDSLLCRFCYPILKLNSWGTNLEIIAQKP